MFCRFALFIMANLLLLVSFKAIASNQSVEIGNTTTFYNSAINLVNIVRDKLIIALDARPKELQSLDSKIKITSLKQTKTHMKSRERKIPEKQLIQSKKYIIITAKPLYKQSPILTKLTFKVSRAPSITLLGSQNFRPINLNDFSGSSSSLRAQRGNPCIKTAWIATRSTAPSNDGWKTWKTIQNGYIHTQTTLIKQNKIYTITRIFNKKNASFISIIKVYQPTPAIKAPFTISDKTASTVTSIGTPYQQIAYEVTLPSNQFKTTAIDSVNNLQTLYKTGSDSFNNKPQFKLASMTTIALMNDLDQGYYPATKSTNQFSNNDDFDSLYNHDKLTPLKNTQSIPTTTSFESAATPCLRNTLQDFPKDNNVMMSSGRSRIWITPYYTKGNTASYAGQPAVRDHYEGTLIGVERRSLNNKWTVGFLTGAGIGNASFTQFVNTNRRDENTFFGLYHSLKFLEHARYDLNLNTAFNNHKTQRSGSINANTSYLAFANYNSRTLSASLETSYQFKLQGNSSFRPNLGFTYAENQQNAYQEWNAGVNNLTVGRIRNHTQEIYGGLGFRHSWKVKQFEYKLTGMWEHGCRLTNQATPSVYTVSGPKQGFVIINQATDRQTNYFTVYGSALNTSNNIKFAAGYKAAVQKHRTVHAFTLKAEYRF
jgi:hypothetical protein